MTIARIAPWVALAVLSLACSASAQAQSPWPAPAAGPGQFPAANPPAAAPAAQGQFPAANAPQMLPQQPGTVPPPSQWGNAGGGAAPAGQHPAWGGGGAQGGPPPCVSEIMPLRNDAQSKGMAIKAAVDRKDRGELCKAFKTFVAAEAKFAKFAAENSSRCGISPDDVKVIKTNHSKSITTRNQICNAAAGPGAPPPPSLSDALGTSRIPDSSNTKTGKGGTFDTLSGGTLAR